MVTYHSSRTEDIPLDTFEIFDTETETFRSNNRQKNMDSLNAETALDDESTQLGTEIDDPLLDQEISAFRNAQKSKISRFFIALWTGPDEVKDDPPSMFEAPWLKPLEELPYKFNGKVSRSTKSLFLGVYLLLWSFCIYSVLYPYFTVPPSISGSDTVVRSLGCTDQLWRGKNAACGLNGEDCVHESKDVFVRCPALCDRSWTYSLIPIGDQRIKYRGYFVGGGHVSETPKEDSKKKETKKKDNYSKEEKQLTRPYRADSYICGSAVHAGLVSPFIGGCARVSYKGEQSSFESTKGHYGVDDSISFKSFFPSSFSFKSFKNQYINQCYDPRLLVLILNIVLGVPVLYLGSGGVVFWTINTVGFWTIALATDPPIQVDSTDSETFSSLISIGLERFLPSCFILFALWTFSTKKTFKWGDFKGSYLKRGLCFYPMFWLGVLNNISFDRLPVDRFTLADLKEQPGGAVAVSCIVLFVISCAIIQAYKVWQAGHFKQYLFIYLGMLFGLVLIAHLPGLTLRVHHYILAMLLIPGCFTKGSTALLFQGILLGLFLSGAAKWGLAAIGETDTSLRRNDPSGKILPPQITGFDVETGLLSWNITGNDGYNGISLLINDIERFVAENVTGVDLKQVIGNATDLKRFIESSKKTVPLYIRIGKKLMGSGKYSDYSNAAVISWPEGGIELPKPGIT